MKNGKKAKGDRADGFLRQTRSAEAFGNADGADRAGGWEGHSTGVKQKYLTGNPNENGADRKAVKRKCLTPLAHTRMERPSWEEVGRSGKMFHGCSTVAGSADGN